MIISFPLKQLAFVTSVLLFLPTLLSNIVLISSPPFLSVGVGSDDSNTIRYLLAFLLLSVFILILSRLSKFTLDTCLIVFLSLFLLLFS